MRFPIALVAVLLALAVGIAQAAPAGALPATDDIQKITAASKSRKRHARFIRGVSAATAKALAGEPIDDHSFRQQAHARAATAAEAAAKSELESLASACDQASHKARGGGSMAALLFIRNIPIMIGGLGMGFAGGMLLWFFNSPSTFALFLARRVGIDPAMVSRAAASANATDEK